MLRDTSDKILWVLLILTVGALVALLALNGTKQADARGGAGADKGIERQIAYQARVALLQKLYSPVEQLRTEGQLQAALLKLDELARLYPGEAHGSILQGEILLQLGAFDQAVDSYVRGIKLNGDYVDARSPLSRRSQVEKLVKDGLAAVQGRSNANPGNRSLAYVKKNLFYLQSRLAGGCE